MNFFAATAYAYEGVSRWSLWFDNPNKAAVVFALLALVAWAGVCRFGRVALLRDRPLGGRQEGGRAGARPSQLGLPIIALAVFAVCVYALLHTFSRGGMLGLGVGMMVVAGRHWRRWAALVVCVLCLALIPLGRSAVGRLAASAPGADASVGNRLVVWRAVPRMAADAPGGWGLGNSGDAFMGWYQPVERREVYRTLVGSHFTWLVEFGRWGRFAYLAGWLAVLAAAGVWGWRRQRALPLALWLCLGVAAGFSSVAEAWELWVVPVAALAPMAWFGVRAARERRARRVWAWGGWVLAAACVVAGASLAALEWAGRRQARGSAVGIARDGGMGRTVVSVGKADAGPENWIVYDAATMGGPSFGRALRAQLKQLPGRSWGVADRLESVPGEVRHLALCGKAAEAGPSALSRLARLEEIRVLSPENPQSWLAAKIGGKAPRVVCGEFSSACPEDDLPGLVVVPGAGEYLAEWPHYAFGRLDDGR